MRMLIAAIVFVATETSAQEFYERQPYEGERLALADEPPIPECAWTPQARNNLVRMVQLESTRLAEASTIGWALARRWRAVRRWDHRDLPRESFSTSIVTYSRTLRRLREWMRLGMPLAEAAEQAGSSNRQRRILAQTWDTYRGRSGRTLRLLLDNWARGRVNDGCVENPEIGPAMHWCAPYARSPLPVVECPFAANSFRATSARFLPRVRRRLAAPWRDIDCG